jgi:UPF0716 family protein affecting phage T7 exclusion
MDLIMRKLIEIVLFIALGVVLGYLFAVALLGV